MAKQKFSLKNAEQVRQTTTMSQQKEIKRLYEQLYQDVTRKVGQLGNNNLQKQNLILLQRDIKNRIAQLNSDIQNGIIRDMRIVSNEVVEDTRTFLKQCGFRDEDIHNAFSYVPDQIIRNITSGNVYQDGWTLSSAIWGHNKRVQDDLSKIISFGTAQGKSAVEIAKELERYVDPSARKQAKTIQSWRYDKAGNKIKDSVYFGKIGEKANYTGITKQKSAVRLAQHQRTGKAFTRLLEIHSGLTRNQARALEQYYIENGPNELNKINSISPKNRFYFQAMSWAKQYIETQ